MDLLIHIPEVYACTEEQLKLIVNLKGVDPKVAYVYMHDTCFTEFDCEVLPENTLTIDLDSLPTLIKVE